MRDDDTFQRTVIESIEKGDDGNINMKSLFDSDTSKPIPELAVGDGDEVFKPKVFISTPFEGPPVIMDTTEG